ncbi:MAG: YHS domain-containing protein [Chloroflexota bacterium]
MIAIDPVCKMKVETETAQWKHEHQGETYYFCAPGCMGSFKKDPDKYLSGGGFIQMDHDHDQENHDHNEHDHSDHDHSH